MRCSKPLFFVIFVAVIAGIAYATQPMIVSTNPTIGAVDVDPALAKISVTFDQDMQSGFSWTGGGVYYPPTTGQPQWINKRTCVLPVKLEAGKLYRVGINSKSYQNFRSVNGEPTPPRSIYFVTRGASAELKAKVKPPVVNKFEPPNGTTDVDPNIQYIRVTFNCKMSGGMSWTGGGPTYPEVSGQISWDSTFTACSMPVKLKPNQEYRIGINSFNHQNFASEEGIPVNPVVYTFKTKQ
ncbi:MAG: Ig-like domain-containing protein [bacterium]|nr:Ig-like domain-containing protein [bacterium]